MSKEQYYNKIKRFVYNRFNELEVIERDNGNILYFRYDNEEYAQIRINKKLGWISYSDRFRDKICKLIRLKKVDFEILLSKWVEDTFQMKVKTIDVTDVLLYFLVEDTNQIKFR